MLAEAVPAWIWIVLVAIVIGFLAWSFGTNSNWVRHARESAAKHPWLYAAEVVAMALIAQLVLRLAFFGRGWPSPDRLFIIIPVALVSWVALGAAMAYSARKQQEKRAREERVS